MFIHFLLYFLTFLLRATCIFAIMRWFSVSRNAYNESRQRLGDKIFLILFRAYVVTLFVVISIAAPYLMRALLNIL